MAETSSVPPTAPAATPAATAAPVSVSVTPMPGKPAHDHRNPLGGRVEAVREPAPAAPAKPPAAILGKFKTQADLEKAYVELEKRLGAQTAPAGQPAEPAQGGAESPSAQDAPSKGAQALVARMTQEFASTGQVSPALRQEFRKSTGLDESFIDNQIAYLQAQGTRASELAVERLGGTGAVQELMSWAGKRLSEADRAAFNRAVYSGDESMARFAVDGLAAKYEMEVGRSPRIMAGRKPQEQFAGIQPFQSHEEWTAARRDKRYKADPAYRQEVADRLRVAVKLGLIPA